MKVVGTYLYSVFQSNGNKRYFTRITLDLVDNGRGGRGAGYQHIFCTYFQNINHFNVYLTSFL